MRLRGAGEARHLARRQSPDLLHDAEHVDDGACLVILPPTIMKTEIPLAVIALACVLHAHEVGFVCTVQDEAHGALLFVRHDVFNDVIEVREGGIEVSCQLFVPRQIDLSSINLRCVSGRTKRLIWSTLEAVLLSDEMHREYAVRFRHQGLLRSAR